MDWIGRLEKRFGSWAVPHLALYLIGAQAVGAALLMGRFVDPAGMVLVGGLVRVGQWWRLFSFMMVPRTLSPIWLFFAFYIFYLMGTALERQWGAFRFNLFILCGYLLTLAAAFVHPAAVVSNTFFLGSVFLAFATLFPNFELMLFFVLPVKVKWLGWLTAGMYAMALFTADAGSRLGVAAAFANYLLFFGRPFLEGAGAVRRRKGFAAKQAGAEAQTRHACSECGATDRGDPGLHFRYCSVCGRCFCEKHIGSHRHEA